MIRIQRLLGARPTFPLPSFAGALAVLGSCALLAAAPDRVPAPAQTAAPAAAPAGPDAQLLRLADEVAAAEGVDRDLVRAVIQVESGWNPAAVSPHGSQGLMQLMPRTSQRFGVQDPMDPRQNVQGGVRYLRFLQDRYQGNVALVVAAYNAGEEAVDQARGIPAAEETRRYVPAVLDLYLRKAVR